MGGVRSWVSGTEGIIFRIVNVNCVLIQHIAQHMHGPPVGIRDLRHLHIVESENVNTTNLLDLLHRRNLRSNVHIGICHRAAV